MSKFKSIILEIPPGYVVSENPVICFAGEFEHNLYIQIRLKQEENDSSINKLKLLKK
jgi:hypothetical protein